MAIKPKNSGSLTRTQTASWQLNKADQSNPDQGMDNNDHPSYKALTKYSGNQHGGAAEGNFGRGATKGNTGATANVGKKQPPASSVPAFETAGKKLQDGTFNAGAQVRTPGGTRPFTPSKTENYNGDINRINYGRGPTKGNAQ